MNALRSFLGNDTVFGRLMTRCGILIAANIMFIIFSLPVITAGASWTALYHTMFKTLRGDGELNPFRTFWNGFRSNFRQAFPAWLIFMGLAAFLSLEMFWCSQFTEPVALFRYALAALLMILCVTVMYLFPVMSAFQATLPQLVQNSIYFAVGHPVTLFFMLCVHVIPVLWTYLDAQRLPLYAFAWSVTGFSAVSMCAASLLLKHFRPLLPTVDSAGEIIPEGMESDSVESGAPEQSAKQTLDEMKKLGM